MATSIENEFTKEISKLNLKNIRKIFLLGDLHLGIRNNSIEWSNIQSSFLLDFFLQKIDEEGFDPKTDILVQLGDWHHVRESTNVRIFNLSLKIMEALTSKFKRGVFIILGNHDVYYKDRVDVNSLIGLSKIFNNLHVFSKPQLLEIGKHGFLMLPWNESKDNLKSSLIKYHTKSKNQQNNIFCHADIKGASLNKFIKISSGLDKEDLSKFKKIYAGHIHIRQEADNFLYVGTPYEMDRGDCGNTKGFYILDVSKNKIEEKFIENTSSPKHIKVEMSDLLELELPKIQKLFNNNFIDISIDSTLSSKVNYSIFTNKIKDFKHRRLEFYPYTKEQNILKSDIELSENYEFNIFKILKDFLSTVDFSDDKKNEVFEYFKEKYDLVNIKKNYK
jgi:hypothetical protein